jgi:hypothetical protein
VAWGVARGGWWIAKLHSKIAALSLNIKSLFWQKGRMVSDNKGGNRKTQNLEK